MAAGFANGGGGRLRGFLVFSVLSILFFCIQPAFAADVPPANRDGQTGPLVIAGEVRDMEGRALGGVAVRPEISGTPGLAARTGENGAFFLVVPGTSAQGRVPVSFEKRGYKLQSLQAGAPEGERRMVSYTARMERVRGPALYISAAVLLLVYTLIAFDLLHRTLAALAGAALLLLISHTAGIYNGDYFIISFAEAMRAVDFNVIFLLMGMMVIVGIMRETGIFEWLAHRAFRMSGGNMFVLASLLMAVTAVVSALLDNVTTMLLMAPVLMDVAAALGMSPLALLMPTVLASNIGGATTLIGDPPNIMIGSYAGLTFTDFLRGLTPVIVVIGVVHIVMMCVFYRKDYLAARPPAFGDLMARLSAQYGIKDGRLLFYCLAVMAGVLFLFLMHGTLRMEPGIAALAGAAALMLVSRESIAARLEKDVDWSTLVFFIMLFVLVGACERAGLIEIFSDMALRLSGGSLLTAVLIVLAVSGAASAIIDNIPCTATMLPVVASLAAVFPDRGDVHVLWWALSLGACLGGNATLVGASANLVTAGLAEKEGHPITFFYFLKAGLPVTIMSLAVSALWLVLVEM